MAKKKYIVIPILRTTSGGGAEKDNCSAETEKIGAENAKIESAEKSAETGGNHFKTLFEPIHGLFTENSRCCTNRN